MKRRIAGLGISLVVLGALLAPGVAGAATINVDVNTDEVPNGDADCSLREALQAAGANAANATGCEDGDVGPTLDEIVLPDPTTLVPSNAAYQLTLGELQDVAGGPVLIRSSAPGVRRAITMADLAGSNRAIHTTSPSSDLRLRDLTVTNFDDVLAAAIPTGGVVYGQVGGSSLTVENTKLDAAKVGPNAPTGGVITSDGANLTIKDSEITGGEVTDNGGGLFVDNGVVTIERSSIHANKSDSTATGFGRGGGIHEGLNGGSLNITDSEIFDNDIATANPGGEVSGGGIHAGMALTLKRSLVSDNTVISAGGPTDGGGIYADATLNVSNSTIHENVAGPIATVGGGGGIANTNAAATLTNVTFVDNAANEADHLKDGQAGGTTTYTGSIFSGGVNDPCDAAVTAELVSGGHNAITPSGCPSIGTDLVGGVIGLAALADNGGTIVGGTGGSPIRTAAITSTSNAFNLLPSASCTPAEGTDQRGAGFARPQGSACDAGAFELTCTPAICPPPPAVSPPAETGQRAAALKKCKKKKTKKAKKKCRKKAKRLPA